MKTTKSINVTVQQTDVMIKRLLPKLANVHQVLLLKDISHFDGILEHHKSSLKQQAIFKVYIYLTKPLPMDKQSQHLDL